MNKIIERSRNKVNVQECVFRYDLNQYKLFCNNKNFGSLDGYFINNLKIEEILVICK